MQKKLPTSAWAFALSVILLAVLVIVHAVSVQFPAERLRFVVLLLLAMAAARMKLTLPGIDSNMSMNLPFILIGIAELGLPQALALGALSTFTQSLPKDGKEPTPLQMLFNMCNIVNAVAISGVAVTWAMQISDGSVKVLLIVAAALSFFLADTLPVATIISLSQKVKFTAVWREIVLLTFPYFVLSAGVATIVVTAAHHVGWKAPLLLLPVLYLVYRSFKLYFQRSAPLVSTPAVMARALGLVASDTHSASSELQLK